MIRQCLGVGCEKAGYAAADDAAAEKADADGFHEAHPTPSRSGREPLVCLTGHLSAR